MNKKNLIITFILLATVFGGGLLFKTWYFNPDRILKAKVETWNKRIHEFENEIHNGDIIFQTSLSRQSKAIQLATHSKYSHCGIIYKDNNEFYVFEAIQPVRQTPLNEWIARGENGHFVIKRLRNSTQVLTPLVLAQMKRIGEDFNGKNYDLTFEWSDDKIYCSELIYKIYYRATGIKIGTIQTLKDFDLSNDAVQQKMKERYGDKIPLDEPVISPASIFESDLLITVKEN